MLSGKNSATDAAQDLTKIYKLTLEQPECFPYWILLCKHGLKIKYNTDRVCQMKIMFLLQNGKDYLIIDMLFSQQSGQRFQIV